jgi:hypothetical protein
VLIAGLAGLRDGPGNGPSPVTFLRLLAGWRPGWRDRSVARSAGEAEALEAAVGSCARALLRCAPLCSLFAVRPFSRSAFSLLALRASAPKIYQILHFCSLKLLPFPFSFPSPQRVSECFPLRSRQRTRPERRSGRESREPAKAQPARRAPRAARADEQKAAQTEQAHSGKSKGARQACHQAALGGSAAEKESRNVGRWRPPADRSRPTHRTIAPQQRGRIRELQRYFFPAAALFARAASWRAAAASAAALSASRASCSV